MLPRQRREEVVLDLIIQAAEDEVPDRVGRDVSRAEKLSLEETQSRTVRPGRHADVVRRDREREVQPRQELTQHKRDEPRPAERDAWHEPRERAAADQRDLHSASNAVQVAQRESPALDSEGER